MKIAIVRILNLLLAVIHEGLAEYHASGALRVSASKCENLHAYYLHLSLKVEIVRAIAYHSCALEGTKTTINYINLAPANASGRKRFRLSLSLHTSGDYLSQYYFHEHDGLGLLTIHSYMYGLSSH
jgi:hypothetical protein